MSTVASTDFGPHFIQLARDHGLTLAYIDKRFAFTQPMGVRPMDHSVRAVINRHSLLWGFRSEVPMTEPKIGFRFKLVADDDCIVARAEMMFAEKSPRDPKLILAVIAAIVRQDREEDAWPPLVHQMINLGDDIRIPIPQVTTL